MYQVRHRVAPEIFYIIKISPETKIDYCISVIKNNKNRKISGIFRALLSNKLENNAKMLAYFFYNEKRRCDTVSHP